MSSSKTGEVPAQLTRLGLKITQHGNWPLVKQALWLFNGAPTPAYLPVPYYEAEVVDINDNPSKLPIDVEGDYDVNRLADYVQRLKKQAVVVAVGRSALEQTIRETGGRAAVAVGIGEVTAAGVLPNGTADFGQLLWREYTAGFRKGTMDFPAGLGSYIETENKFVISPEQFTLEPDVLVRDFSGQADMTPLL